jgi:hypothetical protein
MDNGELSTGVGIPTRPPPTFSWEQQRDWIRARRSTTVGLRKSRLFRPPVGWYDVFMSGDTEALLDAFEHLPVEEKRRFVGEVLRRSRPFDSGPMEDEEIGAASAALFDYL